MASPADTSPPPGDRRARRRRETIEEILDIAEDVMTTEGVNGLSLAEIARRLGVQPPSLYRYFPSLMAVYDALFERGQRAHTEVVRAAMAAAPAGLAGLTEGLDAGGRWALEHRALAELMFWRPVPSFAASERAMAPGMATVDLVRQRLVEAVDIGELGAGADSYEAVCFISVLISGVMTQAFSNEPEVPWGEGRFTPLFPRLMQTLPALYPPTA